MSALILPQRESDRQMIEKEPERIRGGGWLLLVCVSLLKVQQELQ